MTEYKKGEWPKKENEEPVYETMIVNLELEVEVKLPVIDTKFTNSHRATGAVTHIFPHGSKVAFALDGEEFPETICQCDFKRLSVKNKLLFIKD